MGLEIDKLDSFSDKKRRFLEVYQESFGNITESCKLSGVSRASYYNWMRDDVDFKEVVDAIQPDELALDFAEKMLYKRIKGESDSCLIFFLKTKGKNRGYVERTQTEDVSEKPKRFVLKMPDNDE